MHSLIFTVNRISHLNKWVPVHNNLKKIQLKIKVIKSKLPKKKRIIQPETLMMKILLLLKIKALKKSEVRNLI